MPLTPTDLRGSAGATGPAGPAGPAGPPGPPGAPQTPSSATPQPIGTATAGTSTDYARGDHAHSGALADLSDVATGGAAAGDLLAYDGATWSPATAPEVIWARFGSQISPANVGDYVTIAGAGGEESTISPAQLALYNPAGDCIVNAAPDLDLQLAAALKINGASGSAGEVLTSAGAGVAPVWAPAAGGASPSSATPQPIGTAAAGTSTDYARGDHVHSAAVTALSDRYQRLALQAASQFAAAGTRDIQTALDAHTTGDAAIILAAPGSYPGAALTITTGKNNVAIVGAAGQPYGGTITSLSAGRGVSVTGTATRIRLQNLQIEGLTTWTTSGAGVHRIDRCQLSGGLTVGASWPAGTQLVITDCEISGTITIPAGFLGVLLFDHCSFGSWTISNGASAAQVIIANSSGIASASSAYTLQAIISAPSGAVTYYDDGAPLITPALAALGATTPATNRIPYYNSSSTATTAPLSATGRDLLTLGSGTAGQVLTSSGAGVSPVWAAASGGSGLPTSQSWTVEFAPTSTSGATLSASGFTLVNLTSGGLFADVWGNVYELLTPTGIGYFYATALTPTSLIPWEIEFDALSTAGTLDGAFGCGVNEETGGKRWRILYNGASGVWQHVNATGAASNLSTPFDVQPNQRIIMGIQSEPRSSRAYFANGQCVGFVNPDANQAAQTAPQVYGFGNLGGGSSTSPIRVYRARVLHNARSSAPPYARIPFPPQQP